MSSISHPVCISLEPLAEAIRQNSKIEGVSIGSQCHVLSLFADDTAIYLFDPITSLPHLITLINNFGAISGFCINYSKTELYPIHITETQKSAIQAEYQFKWVTSNWHHLAVLIPLNLKDLYMVNFRTLLGKVRQMLQSWSSKWLTWMECIALIKSNILPQFFFLFQALPIEIPASTIRGWQTEINNFIWANTHHRVSMVHLSKPSAFGSLGLPLLQSYYDAAQFRHINTYLHDCSAKSWVLIEETSIAPYVIRGIIWNKAMEKPKSMVKNPFLACTLKVWNKYRALPVLTLPFSSVASF